MPNLPTRIIHYPDPRLRRKSVPIERFDATLDALAGRMLDLMKAHNGVGLAGPQVGVCRRIFVCNPSGEPGDEQVYVNPELSELLGSTEAEEGCLSIPDVRVVVRRARRCKVQAYDLRGQPLQVEAEDLLARIVQHEVDHLEGRLIIDLMTGTDRIANKKQIEWLEAGYRR